MKRIFFYSIISILMLIFSCQNKTNIGTDILPEDALVNPEIIDTFSIDAYTLSMDTIVTSEVSNMLMGEYTDPIFGYSKASFICQYGLVEYPIFRQESDHIADSLVLTFELDTVNLNYYGNLNAVHYIQVYRLEKDASLDTVYYGNQDPSEFFIDGIIGQSSLIGEKTIIIDSETDSIRIPLMQSLATELLKAENDVYTSSENFIDFFKGVYIKSTFLNSAGVSNSAILKFSIGTKSLMRLYYHHIDAIMPEGLLSYSLSANTTSSVRFNMYEHDYTGVTFEDNIDNEEDPQDSVAYIQGMGGLRAKINIPYIEDLRNLGNILIYRAELVIKTESENLTGENSYPAIEKLLLAGYSPENEYHLLPEYISGISYLGEDYTEREYRFDIASYLQKILDGTTDNNGFYLFPSSGSRYFNRSVITTGNHSDKMKIYITYMKLQ